MMRRLLPAIAAVALISLQGCFTGVESTPKITYSDVKKEKIEVTKEQKFLSEIAPEPPAKWTKGKKFYVADPKIAIAFSSPRDMAGLMGKDISFVAMRPVASVIGEEVTEIEFATPDGFSVFYRDNLPYGQIGERKQLEIPFTIEESVVDQARAQMLGNKYYIVSPFWYTADGEKAVNGLRHVPVTITEVVPGNAFYPLRVVFSAEDGGEERSVYMTVGNQRTATRNFHTLFAFDNPRDKHPRISNENWALITHSKVREGMTREECRLALGSPQTIGQRPSSAGMIEYWQYPDGIYLLFEDGCLVNPR